MIRAGRGVGRNGLPLVSGLSDSRKSIQPLGTTQSLFKPLNLIHNSQLSVNDFDVT